MTPDRRTGPLEGRSVTGSLPSSTVTGSVPPTARVTLECDEEHPERGCTATYWGEILGADSRALHMRVDRFLDDAWTGHPLLSPVGKQVLPWSRIVHIDGYDLLQVAA